MTTYPYKRFFRWSLSSLFLITLFFSDTIAQSFPVGNTSITFVDSSRNNRNIPCDVYYPGTSNGFEVDWSEGSFGHIVFGHGFLMTASNYETIASALAASGFIVLLPTTEGGFLPSHENFGRDLAFVAEEVISKSGQEGDFFYEKAIGNFAIGGHSMGGGSTYLSHQFLNLPARCYFSFAAAETNPSANAAISNLGSPNLMFAGELDCVTPPNVQKTMYDNQPADVCKYYVEILGGFHCQFNDPSFTCSIGEGSCSPGGGIDLNQQLNLVLSMLLPWLDSWLNTNCTGWDEFKTEVESSEGIDFNANCTIENQPNPRVHISGSLPLCPGEEVILSADGNGGMAPGWNNGLTNSSFNTDEPGFYFYILELENCILYSDTVEITAITTPDVSIEIEGQQNSCEGDTILLIGDEGLQNFVWNTGDSSTVLSTLNGGYYFFTYTLGPCFFQSEPVEISFTEDPQARIVWDETVTNCPGDSLWLTASVSVDEVIWNSNFYGDSLLVTTSQMIDFRVRLGDCLFDGEAIEVLFEEDWIPGAIIGPDSVLSNLTYLYAITGDQDWAYNWSGDGLDIVSGQGSQEVEVQINAHGLTDLELFVRIDDLMCKDTLVTKNIIVEPSLHTRERLVTNVVVRYGSSGWHFDFEEIDPARNMTLTDLYGRIINVYQNVSNKLDIENGHLPSGIYLLTISAQKDSLHPIKLMKP